MAGKPPRCRNQNNDEEPPLDGQWIFPGTKGVEEARIMNESEALIAAEGHASYWPGTTTPFTWFILYMQPHVRQGVINWSEAARTDAYALYTCVYCGSGTAWPNDAEDGVPELVRVRYLTGPRGAHYGLRPIRSILVSLLILPLFLRERASAIKEQYNV